MSEEHVAFDNRTPDDDPGRLSALRAFVRDERLLFVLWFLIVSVLILLLIALLRENIVLVREKVVLVREKQELIETKVVLETRIIREVNTCKVECTDRMSTSAAIRRTTIAQITETSDALPPSDTPVPLTTLTPTHTALPTPTDTPTWTPTPTPTPSPTWTPTSTPLPTWTPVPTPTPSPTWTPVTPTDTPMTPSPTHTFSPSPTPTPPPPEVWSITPNEAVQSNDPPFPVTITGQNFRDPVEAWLGDRTQNISISNPVVVLSTTITGMLSPNIPADVYALTVQNNDNGQSGYRSPAFIVHPAPHPTNTFASEVAYVTTFGPGAELAEGDNDHVQIIFFEVPDTAPDNLYVRIFDADTGSVKDELSGPSDTVMTYTVRGGVGAYSNDDARSERPGSVGINSGQVITQQVVGEDNALDNDWLTLPVTRTAGEPVVGGGHVFKLVVQGAAGNDGNWYQVAISSDSNNNVAVDDSRIFAYSWCLVPPDLGHDAVPLYPYVPAGTGAVTQFNFDFDNSGSITLTTPLRNLVVSPGGISGDEDTASKSFPITRTGETATTWSARYLSGRGATRNEITIWFTGDGEVLPMFVSPTTDPPPSVSIESGGLFFRQTVTSSSDLFSFAQAALRPPSC
jgi:hypothetical protein